MGSPDPGGTATIGKLQVFLPRYRTRSRANPRFWGGLGPDTLSESFTAFS